jgi:thiamine biosynthesis protein ThiS
MRLRINDENREIEKCDSVAMLLENLGVDPERVAVLVNETVVPKAARGSHCLQDEDRVVLVTFLAGG